MFTKFIGKSKPKADTFQAYFIQKYYVQRCRLGLPAVFTEQLQAVSVKTAKPGMRAYSCNANTWEAETRGQPGP